MIKYAFLKLPFLSIFFISHLTVAQITDTGDKVGVGIMAPQEKFSLPLNSEIGFAYQSGSPSQLRIKGANNGMHFTSAYTTTQTDQSFAFYTMNSTPVEVQRLTILNNGKMGFSTIFSPQERITLPWEEQIGFSHASGAMSQIRIKGGVNGMSFFSAYTTEQTATAFTFYGMNDSGSEKPRVTILNNGQINAGALEISDVNTWPDFVFKDNYKLLPLTEVERFIKLNGHLPEVPSEEEIKKDGINVAEINAILLQKIEELTLYMIAQDKAIETLKKENLEIKAKLN
jgi:hypothetical protein